LVLTYIFDLIHTKYVVAKFSTDFRWVSQFSSGGLIFYSKNAGFVGIYCTKLFQRKITSLRFK